MSSRTDGSASCRTIIVTQHCPPAMRKRDVWRIDHFHLLRKVGSGYASTVYLGTCRTTGNQVAIKLYHKNKLSELNHFQVAREITIHSGLDHKHIIQLWAAFEDQYGIYLVFEYASKGDVFTEVERRGGQLNETEAVRQVVYPFLSALDYLHSNYIIHRDIKPENLLFTATGVLKVGDFGLSINFSQERPVTRVGTLDYMAPEVVVCPDKHRPQDHKELKHLHYTPLVDAWAVGVLAYELIVGRPPFDKGQKKATIQEILNGEPFLPPWLSEAAVHFIKWALTKDQSKRPSVQQLAEHPWVVSHMKQAALASARRQLVKTDSFVEPRQLGFRGSNAPAESSPSSSKDPPRPLQVASVAQGGRTLGHSNSMSAVDGMRYRDIHIDSVTGGMAGAAEAALSAVKRVSDGDGTTGGRPSAAGGRVSRAGTARNSAAGGGRLSRAGTARNSGAGGLSLSRMGSFSSSAAAAAAAAVAAEEAEQQQRKAGRPMTREELLASLTAPSGARSLNMMRSFTAGRPSALHHASGQQPGLRTSGSGGSAATAGGGGGGGVSPYALGRPHSPGPASPLSRSVPAPPQDPSGAAGRLGHGHAAASPSSGLQPHASADLALDLGRLRVDTSHSGAGAAALHSPKSGSTTQLRPQPPQAPSPSARGLKAGSPLIPSRLSQSFTSPISPLAATTSVQHPPSRLGMPSNSGSPHATLPTRGQSVIDTTTSRFSNDVPGGVAPAAYAHGHSHAHGSPAAIATSANGWVDGGGGGGGSGSVAGRLAGAAATASPASPSVIRELPGEREDFDERESPPSGNVGKDISKSRGLFGSFKKVFS